MERSDRTPFSKAAAKADKDGLAGSTLGIAASMGLHLVSGPLVGAALGYGLDRLFGTRFLIMVMIFVGIVAGFRMLFEDARRLNRLHSEDKRTRRDDAKPSS